MARSKSKTDWSLFAVVGMPLIPLAIFVVAPFLSKWSPFELVGLIAVLTAAALVMTALIFWRHISLAQADAAAKQSLLQIGLSSEEIERLLRGGPVASQSPVTEIEAIQDMAKCLGQSGVSEGAIEQIFSALRAVDPPTRLALCHAIRGLAGDSGAEASEEQILATMRGLCGNPPAAPVGASATHGDQIVPAPITSGTNTHIMRGDA
jgi:hypothetical protein